MTGHVGAGCNDGILLVDPPQKRWLKRKRWFGRQWYPQPFNLFYADLQTDARERLDNHIPWLAAKRRQLTPITETVDLQDSPINKVPN